MIERDLVAAINGERVATVDDLLHHLAQWPIGKPLSLSILRDGGRQGITLVPQGAR